MIVAFNVRDWEIKLFCRFKNKHIFWMNWNFFIKFIQYCYCLLLCATRYLAFANFCVVLYRRGPNTGKFSVFFPPLCFSPRDSVELHLRQSGADMRISFSEFSPHSVHLIFFFVHWGNIFPQRQSDWRTGCSRRSHRFPHRRQICCSCYGCTPSKALWS